MYFVLYKPLESWRIPFVGEGPPSSLPAPRKPFEEVLRGFSDPSDKEAV